MKRENVIRKSAEELSLKNDLLRRLIRELVTPGEKNEPLKIYADNKESYFQASYIPIENAAAEEGEARNLGDVILLKNITEFKRTRFCKNHFYLYHLPRTEDSYFCHNDESSIVGGQKSGLFEWRTRTIIEEYKGQ